MKEIKQESDYADSTVNFNDITLRAISESRNFAEQANFGGKDISEADYFKDITLKAFANSSPGLRFWQTLGHRS